MTCSDHHAVRRGVIDHSEATGWSWRSIIKGVSGDAVAVNYLDNCLSESHRTVPSIKANYQSLIGTSGGN